MPRTAAGESRWMHLDGMRVHYRHRGGPGPAVMLLPGGMLDSSLLTWKHVFATLPARYCVVAPDLPGYGQSAKPQAPYTIAYYVDFVERLADALALEQVHLFGASMSGAVALGWALRQPSRVRQLVLGGAYGFQPRVPLHPLAYLACRLPGLAGLVRRALRGHPLVMRLALRVAIRQSNRITDELVGDALAGVDPESLHADRDLDAFLAWMRHELTPRRVRSDFTGQLHRLAMPVLLLHGAHDWMMPVRYVRRAARRIPHADLQVFDRCGHMVPREAPERTYQLVADFLP